MLGILGAQRLCLKTVVKQSCPDDPRIDDGLAGSIGSGWIHLNNLSEFAGPLQTGPKQIS